MRAQVCFTLLTMRIGGFWLSWWIKAQHKHLPPPDYAGWLRIHIHLHLAQILFVHSTGNIFFSTWRHKIATVHNIHIDTGSGLKSFRGTLALMFIKAHPGHTQIWRHALVHRKKARQSRCVAHWKACTIYFHLTFKNSSVILSPPLSEQDRVSNNKPA